MCRRLPICTIHVCLSLAWAGTILCLYNKSLYPWAYAGFAREGAQHFGGLGELHAAKRLADAWRSHALARGVRGHVPPQKIF